MPASITRRSMAAALAAIGLTSCAALGVLSAQHTTPRPPRAVADTTWGGSPVAPTPSPAASASPLDTTWGG
jgi:hypothetical protein